MTSKPVEFDHQSFVKTLPQLPGVYRMLNADQEILYVGKARALQKRVSSYFSKAHNTRIARMVAQIHSIEVTITRTEGEALLLEDQLIKAHKPRYNVLLKDDKSYPQIFLSSKSDFPKLSFHRGPQRRKGDYFGPFPSAFAVRDTIELIQKLFRIRSCRDHDFAHRSRPCLQHQIGRCTAPCVDYVSQPEYQKQVEKARLFLGGKSDQLIRYLEKDMQQAAQSLQYEQAAAIRDQITRVQKVAANQFVAGAEHDIDAIGFAVQGTIVVISVMVFRNGRNLGIRNYHPKVPQGMEPAEILESFISRHYVKHPPPRQILLNQKIPDKSFLEDALPQPEGPQVKIIMHPRGDRAGWVRLATANATHVLGEQLYDRQNMAQRYSALQAHLNLQETPTRMECFDISHTMGEFTVASCVVFGPEGPIKADYRRFNIKNITAGDDYEAMRQALSRRYKRVQEEGIIPDIVLIDGGLGQFNAAVAIFDELSLPRQPLLIGVVKGDGRKAGLERFITAQNIQGDRWNPDDPAALLLQHIRDEAHRFAITGHRGKRGKARNRSVLEDIPGVGAAKRKALLSRFGGIQGVRNAGVEELGKVSGIHQKLAQRIYDALH